MDRAFPRGSAPLTACLLGLAAAACLLRPAGAFADDGDRTSMEVRSEEAIVYSLPDTGSPVLRRLFQGEIVEALSVESADDGTRWVRVVLGAKRQGWVPERDLSSTESPKRRRLERREIARDSRPFSFAVKGMGETGGGTLGFRYLPFTRLGMAFNVGAVLDDREMKGTSFSASLVSLIALANVSPLLEVGFARLSYHASRSTMGITAVFFTVGLEWMLKFGLFINAGVTYLRSTDLEITHELEDAVDGDMSLETYGKFDDLRAKNAYQAIQPCFSVGYAF